MGFGELMLLAVGVSMDAFAVSICKGLAMKKATLKAGLTCGIWFGGFQALMPVIGFFLGMLFAEAIQAIDHWVAFVLLYLPQTRFDAGIERLPVSGKGRQHHLRKPWPGESGYHGRAAGHGTGLQGI